MKTINGSSILGTGDLTVTGSGATWGSITGTLSSQTDLQNELDGKLDLDGGNANTDIDIDVYSMNAKSFHAKGTAGAGHVGLKHQSANITASASESTIGANVNGDPVWKNDGNPIQKIMLENTAITGETKTKITYDAKGLVTSGADATTADIADSTNKRYVTDANLVVIGNTSGTNTGNNSTNTLYEQAKKGSFGVTIDGGSTVLTTGNKGYITIPYSGIITGWQVIANALGSCIIDVWKGTVTIPTVANTITGTEKPTLSSQQINSDLALTSWTTAVSVGDIIAFNIDSATTITRVNLSIFITKQ